MKLKTIKVNGVSCDVNVREHDGMFTANVSGDHLDAPTLSALELQLQKATKRAKVVVAVPVSVLGRQQSKRPYPQWVSGFSVQHVTLTGIDANGNIRCLDDSSCVKGRLDTLAGTRRWDSGVVRRLTGEEVAEYERLAKARHDAEEALAAFEQSVKLKESAENLVKAAIAAKVDTPEEPAEEPFDPRIAPVKRRKRSGGLPDDGYPLDQ